MDKVKKAFQKFGFIATDVKTREILKIIAEKEDCPELKVLSHWSRSLIASNYDLRHPTFLEYSKHYQIVDVEWLPIGKTYVDMVEYIKENKNELEIRGNIENKMDIILKEFRKVGRI